MMVIRAGAPTGSWGALLREIQGIVEQNSLVRVRGTAEAEAVTLVCAALDRLKAGMQESSASSPLPESTRSGLWWAAAEPAPAVVADQARAWAEERAQGKVLQHLTGEQAFLEHVYEVSNEVLIPRPETEGLVILALELLSAEVARNQKIQLGFEVGLGSGVVSIELLQARPDLQMVASEVSAGARAVAMRNLARVLRTERAQPSGALPLEILAPTSPEEVLAPFEQWVHLYGRKADFFISNPPYLARSESGSEVSETDSEVREQEPALALFPSEALGDPLAFYRIFSEGLAGCLRPEGWLIVELADERARETAQLFELVSTRAGTACWDEVHLHPDLTGKLRYLSARRAK